MLTKRIIPCLDVMEGRVVKGVRFGSLSQVGDVLQLAKRYSDSGADELVFLDITATADRRKTVYSLASDAASRISIPFTIGGGIRTAGDMGMALRSGADKIAINSAAFRNPALIAEGANRFGSQAIVMAVDVRRYGNGWSVVIDGGKTETDRDAVEWIFYAVSRGAGEILVTSIDRDGTKRGFDTELLRSLSPVHVPVIASGGAGKPIDFYEAFTVGMADGALAASLFHSGELEVGEVKQYLFNKNIPIRL